MLRTNKKKTESIVKIRKSYWFSFNDLIQSDKDSKTCFNKYYTSVLSSSMLMKEQKSLVPVEIICFTNLIRKQWIEMMKLASNLCNQSVYISVRLDSDGKPLLGLFAGRTFLKGEVICNYGGLLRSIIDLKHEKKTHAYRTFNDLCFDGVICAEQFDRTPFETIDLAHKRVQYSVLPHPKIENSPLHEFVTNIKTVFKLSKNQQDEIDGKEEKKECMRTRSNKTSGVDTFLQSYLKALHYFLFSVQTKDHCCGRCRLIYQNQFNDTIYFLLHTGIGWMANQANTSHEINLNVKNVSVFKSGTIDLIDKFFIAKRQIEKHEELLWNYKNTDSREILTKSRKEKYQSK